MEADAATVTPRSQVTLPAEVRRRLGIRARDQAIFAIEEGQVRLLPATFTLESAAGSVEALGRVADTEDQVREAKGRRPSANRGRGAADDLPGYQCYSRNLTRDDPAKMQACLALSQRVQAGEQATATEVVLAEVAFGLSSPRQYGLSHADGSARLRPLIALRGLRAPNKRRILRALDRYATYPHLDFEDCLTMAQVEQRGIATLVSYDRGFDRAPGVAREEPSGRRICGARVG